MCRYIAFIFLLIFSVNAANAQCTSADIMEPGFAFLTSSRGCAPFNVQLQTLFLQSTPGTVYYVDWGDGTPEEVYVQGPAPATGVVLSHVYPNSPVDCGYDLIIDAENACNPRGSVVPVETQVIVWTNDVINVDPGVFRVCQGYAASLQFADNSDWNCFPRATRENNEARWVQWIYGIGAPGNRIPGIQVGGVTPGGFPYNDPNPANNPKFPINAPGDLSLTIDVPVTAPADIGREFVVELKNWNQCNEYAPYADPFNPVNGDVINGDNLPVTTTARVVIVDSPEPNYQTRLNNAAGPVQTLFCIDEDIYFQNLTPAIGGANFQWTWEFFDNNTGAGAPVSTSVSQNPTFAYSTAGQKLIRLTVRDANAAGNCEAVYESTVTISPSLVAQIELRDVSNNPISGIFCQEVSAPTIQTVRFADASIGTVTANTRWRWEFFDENDVLIDEFPGGGAYSSSVLGPFDRNFTSIGNYRARLYILDNATSCESVDEAVVTLLPNPEANFTTDVVCEGEPTHFTDFSTLSPLGAESIVSWEWDFNYDGSSFNKNPAFDNQTDFDRTYATAGTYDVALRVTTDLNNCSDLFVQSVTVHPQPIADISASNVSGCSISTITFTNNGAFTQPAAIDQYIWEIDEGSGYVVDFIQDPDDPSFSNEYNRDFQNLTLVNKIFDVRLRVVTDDGCEAISNVVTVTVLPGPRSGFIDVNYNPFDDNCSPISVDFVVDAETQSLNPDFYLWEIFDTNGLVYQENTGGSPNFNFEFSNNSSSLKDFQVKLTTTLVNGCVGDSTRTIRVNPVPVTTLSVDTLLYDCERMELLFEAQPEGLNVYNWTVLENSITSLATSGGSNELQYTFNRANSLINAEVQLTAENFAGCAGTMVAQSIDIPQEPNINAGFDVTPLNQTLPNSTVNITNTTTAGTWTYLWDFGDGTTSSDPNISEHSYATYGTYTITLTVSDGQCQEQAIRSVTILPIPPVVDFTYDPATGCAPLTVNFTNLSQFADADSYYWEFGDGNTSILENPSHTYYDPGTYSVSLTASNAAASVTENKQMIITVSPSPLAIFDVRPNIVLVPDNPIYIANRSIDATDFLWDFGDGTSSRDDEPVHYYQQAGTYTVTLIASNSAGCTDTLARQNIVEAKDSGRILIPNAFSPNLNGPLGGEGGGAPGTNDIFLPITRQVVEFEMLIFNRWGELLFQTRDQNVGWDGYYQGKLCPQDVYVYKMTVVFENGDRTVKTGDVNLIR